MSAVAKPTRLAMAAEGYAKHGWHVFPVQPRGKLPVEKGGGGFLSATDDVARIREWWGRWPHANIGLWPGRSGLVVIDLDGPVGIESAQTLGLLSEPTLECQSGREDGGRHLYFRHPGFTISNSAIGRKLDVRADGGYVVLPPSVHPTGRVYRWQGRIDEVRELPPGVLQVLRDAQTGALSRVQTEAGVQAAREIPFEPITEGGRNNALTRYAGRLLAKGLGEEEVLLSLHAINAQYVKPPLPAGEVNALVANIASRETQKRTTSTGVQLQIVNESTVVEHSQSPQELVDTQVQGAKDLAARDLSGIPRWMWSELDNLVGGLLPGSFTVVGGLMGNGKSSALMSQMNDFARRRIPTLYFPLEIDPEIARLIWAAWTLGLDVEHVMYGRWERLPEGSREAVDLALDEQAANPFIHFATPKRVTFAAFVKWCRWAVEEFGCQAVMVDHFHRMEFVGDSSGSHRIGATEIARGLRDIARELKLALITAAHLNRVGDPIDPYMAPSLSRLKETSALGEEADVVLMISRKLRAPLPDKWTQRLREGTLSESDLADPGIMTMTCRKHRIMGRQRDKAIFLRVENGRVMSRAPSWRDEEEQEPWYQR